MQHFGQRSPKFDPDVSWRTQNSNCADNTTPFRVFVVLLISNTYCSLCVVSVLFRRCVAFWSYPKKFCHKGQVLRCHHALPVAKHFGWVGDLWGNPVVVGNTSGKGGQTKGLVRLEPRSALKLLRAFF